MTIKIVRHCALLAAIAVLASCAHLHRGARLPWSDARQLVLVIAPDWNSSRGTLRTYSRPVDLSRFDHRGWMTDPNDVWYIAEYLLEISHTELLTPWQRKNLNRLDKRSYESGLHGHRSK